MSFRGHSYQTPEEGQNPSVTVEHHSVYPVAEKSNRDCRVSLGQRVLLLREIPTIARESRLDL